MIPRSELEWLGLELALSRYFVGHGEAKAMILVRLCHGAGRVMSPDRLTINSRINPGCVKYYICELREALNDLGYDVKITTAKGQGYSIGPEDANKIYWRVAQTLNYLRDAA